ncbi:MAG: DUF1992 domain-containing protein [Anaerolineae bacterium]|nr:DUF1992 domain-containing protein [Caldilineales bacterium]MCX7851284.1 DUF1992 domain-containing protein [Caldilineales bacterium]MDW8267812.1 DUF1992 domain-containing protein [Anaerolineae bacterium]
MSDSASSDTPPRKPAEQSWDNWVEERIREAQQAGLFDNLPGAGQPLSWRRNPFAPSDQQLAFDLIQNAGYTLPWIEEGREIDDRIARARSRLQRDYAWYRRARDRATAADLLAVEAVWQRRREAFSDEVIAINRAIDLYNLKAPSVQVHKLRLVLADELARLEQAP